MSTLHTINRSPDSSLLDSCLRLVRPGDGILFIEDGVYHCNSVSTLEHIDESVKVYGLREDMLARATLGKIVTTVEIIDTNRFVELCGQHNKVVSWF